jgi:hypothetical protein
MENVVAMLAAMPINKRSKVVAEFTSADEAAKLSEILKLMGEGAPLAPMIDNALKPAVASPAAPR